MHFSVLSPPEKNNPKFDSVLKVYCTIKDNNNIPLLKLDCLESKNKKTKTLVKILFCVERAMSIIEATV